MTARDDILNRLRENLRRRDLRFPPEHPEPLTAATRMTVTRAEGDLPRLAERFGRELETLHGTYEIVGSPVEARLTVINRIRNWMLEEATNRKGARLHTGQEESILSWDPDALPVPGLREAFADLNMHLVTPAALDTPEERDEVRFIRYGLTGVEAAAAATGSMIMLAGPRTSRAASLLPLRHIALIPFSRLYPTMEDWLAERRAAGQLDRLLRESANLTLITGPSKSADIEFHLTLGVHGPQVVHAILFED
jgi:L-lactate dehydrogenase complex protein LldG